jgi:valyl-tRNA synthetase
MISRARAAFASATKSFDQFDYARAMADINGLFWRDFCDNYLEFVKDRCYETGRFTRNERLSAQQTLLEVFRMILGGFAPFVPFVTEEIYGFLYRDSEGARSIHVTPWPSSEGPDAPCMDGEFLAEVIGELRKARSEQKIGASTIVERVLIGAASEPLRTRLEPIWRDLESASRARSLRMELGDDATGIPGLTVAFVLGQQDGG